MKFISIGVDCDFCDVGFEAAVDRICKIVGADYDGLSGVSMILSSEYSKVDAISSQFKIMGRLCIPFEISQLMPKYSWCLIHDPSGIIIYSSGAG